MLLLEVCGLAVPRSCGDARELHGLALAVDDDLRVVGELIAASFAYDTVLFDEAGAMRRAQSLTRVLPHEKDRQTLGIQVPQGMARRCSGKKYATCLVDIFARQRDASIGYSRCALEGHCPLQSALKLCVMEM